MKLINLLILFVFLQFLIPLLKIDDMVENIHLQYLIIASIIGIVQLIYNYIMVLFNKKQTSHKDKIINAVFKAVIVLCGMYLFEEIKKAKIEMSSSLKYNKNDIYKSSFLTLLLTFFILIKCLITP